MNRRSLLTVFCLSFVLVGSATGFPDEEEQAQPAWKHEIIGSLNATQASFDNWAQGGENTLAWQMNVNCKFVNVGQTREWLSTVRIAYGMAKVGDEESRKSVDEMKLETVFTYSIGFHMDPYVAATAETQLLKGYSYDLTKTAISDFLDPGYFTQSVGVGRSYRDILRSRLGLSVKETVADDYAYLYTRDTETQEVKKTRIEVGMESVTDLDLKLRQNLLFTSRVELFSNLKASKEIDIKWDNLLTAKVEEYVEVTLNLKISYDRDISSKRQMKQSLGLGLTYAFL